MTLREGFKHLIHSEKYRQDARPKDSAGGKLRGYATRYRKKKLGEKTMINVLKKYGYTITPLEVQAPE